MCALKDAPSELTACLLDDWSEVAERAPHAPDALVTHALVRALEASGEVVATAACSA